MDVIWEPLDLQDLSKYEINKLGKVRNKRTRRVLSSKDNISYTFDNDSGSKSTINNDSRSKSVIKVDVLMMLTFVGPSPGPQYIIKHIDNNLANNSLDNLQYENIIDFRKSEANIKTFREPDEEWKSCEAVEFPYYLVSSFGRVYTCITGKIMSSYVDDEAYERLKMVSTDGHQKHMSIHRLVCRVFHGAPPNNEDYTVDHIDRNRLNNKSENLKWATYAEQAVNKEYSENKQRYIFKIQKNGAIIAKFPEDKALELIKSNNAFLFTKGVFFDGFYWIAKERWDLPNEEWRDIIFEGRSVKISNMGRFEFENGRKTNGTLNYSGYRSVGVNYKRKSLHRLVIEGFYGEIPDGLVVNHIDGNKSNNKLENLEVVTPSENSYHTYMTGTDCGKKVKQLTPDGKVVHIYASIKEASRITGMSSSNISLASTFNRMGGKFYWKFVQPDDLEQNVTIVSDKVKIPIANTGPKVKLNIINKPTEVTIITKPKVKLNIINKPQ